MHAAPVHLVQLLQKPLPIAAHDPEWYLKLSQAVWGDPFSPELVS